MEKGRKKLRFCLLFVVILAVFVGMVYYYGQLREETPVSEGTLISALGMEMKQLWQ